jgi:NAD+ synthase
VNPSRAYGKDFLILRAMNYPKISEHITNWLKSYCQSAGLKGFVVGISGGIDSAVTSTLCAKTGLEVIVLSMPIHQKNAELGRAIKHIEWLKENYKNVTSQDIDLTNAFDSFSSCMPMDVQDDFLSLANARARLRMTTLYAVGQTNKLLVAGTGNKVEDFGVGFYTKYGDGGVDLSPIADLMKSDVYALAAELNVIPEIQNARPTDGLWEDGRTDEDQLGASYDELEWAMEFNGDETELSNREMEVLKIYRRLNRINLHKMKPIPVCEIPDELKA